MDIIIQHGVLCGSCHAASATHAISKNKLRMNAAAHMTLCVLALRRQTLHCSDVPKVGWPTPSHCSPKFFVWLPWRPNHKAPCDIYCLGFSSRKAAGRGKAAGLSCPGRVCISSWHSEEAHRRGEGHAGCVPRRLSFLRSKHVLGFGEGPSGLPENLNPQGSPGGPGACSSWSHPPGRQGP